MGKHLNKLKNTYKVSFTVKKLRKIDDRINAIFDKYLEKNPDEEISEMERARLLGLVKDQLTTYVQSLSHEDKWTMEHKRVPVTVLSDEKTKENDLISVLDENEPEYFYRDEFTWLVSNIKGPGAMSKAMFDKAVTEDIYISAETAAFYAIDSYISSRNGLGFEFN